jgi:predicted enzyme related to lactoylglutathione lyase
MPGGGLYIVLKVDGEDVAGIFPITPEMGEMPSAWGAYFGAADVDASAERAQSLGATMVMPPTDIPGGRFSVLMDPQQVPFGLYQAS